jgi:hypothetical protein
VSRLPESERSLRRRILEPMPAGMARTSIDGRAPMGATTMRATSDGRGRAWTSDGRPSTGSHTRDLLRRGRGATLAARRPSTGSHARATSSGAGEVRLRRRGIYGADTHGGNTRPRTGHRGSATWERRPRTLRGRRVQIRRRVFVFVHFSSLRLMLRHISFRLYIESGLGLT